ncbi:MAG: hypothetical protein PHP82_01985 [Candidatus ainarchaeum sp.]|nr:hypothetical protein [Candidatus ainarchaeum sp.]
MKFFKKNKNFEKKTIAQGTIEYLIIIGVVVIVGLIVVALLTNFFDDAQNISTVSTRIGSTTGTFNVGEAIFSNDNNGLLIITNNSNDALSITSLNVGGIDTNYNTTLFQGNKKIFSIPSIGETCSCTNLEGKTKICEITFNYETKYGLKKKFTTDIVVNCIEEAIPKNYDILVQPVYETIAPIVLLENPIDGYATQNSFVDVNFFVDDDSQIQSCKIIVNGFDVNILTNISNGEYNVGRIDLLSIGEGKHDWDINCIDIYGNFSLSSNQRAIDYFVCPTGYILVPGSTYFDVNSFCVMKFNAKNVSGVPTSQADSNPWSLSVSSAYSTCATLGEGYHLITNREWMVIARNIESTTINDMSIDDEIQLAVGHSDGGGFLAGTNDPIISGCNLEKTMDDSDNIFATSSCEIRGDGINSMGYYGTGNQWTGSYTSGSGQSQLRTFVLNNGEIIWDLAGNTHEVVDLMEDGTAIPTGAACTSSSDNSYFGNDGSNECVFQNNYAKISAIDKRYELGPDGNYNRYNGVGLITGTNSAVGLWKGGARDWAYSAGIYSAYLWSSITANDGSEGFRCVIIP